MTNKPRVAPAFVKILFTALLTSPLLLADGYRNAPEGARAIGSFGGHRAFADDANATIHNSANLVDLNQPMIQYNATFGYGRTSFKNAAGSDQTENPFFAIPGFSAAVPFKDGKYALGLATYIPYGRSVDWGHDSFFAASGASYSGSMMVADFTPNFAATLSKGTPFSIALRIALQSTGREMLAIVAMLHSKPDFYNAPM